MLIPRYRGFLNTFKSNPMLPIDKTDKRKEKDKIAHLKQA
jgi:hypothetical protein